MKVSVIAAACLMLFACKEKNLSFQEAKGRNLTVQIMKINNNQDKSEMIYQVRLLPDKSIMEKLTAEKRNEIWYRMDSCFYIKTKDAKISANLVQPIANGQTQNFEFMLSFLVDNAITDSSTLVYQDKYLNKETYNFKLNLQN